MLPDIICARPHAEEKGAPGGGLFFPPFQFNLHFDSSAKKKKKISGEERPAERLIWIKCQG